MIGKEWTRSKLSIGNFGNALQKENVRKERNLNPFFYATDNVISLSTIIYAID